MAARTRLTEWAEFDDMLTSVSNVEDLVKAIWLIAGNPDVPANICGALQQVASDAQTRLYGIHHTLEGCMEDAANG